MDVTKKANRWLAQIRHCYEQTNAIIAQTQEGQHSAAFLAHCQERLEFYAARDKVLAGRMRRLERQLKQEIAAEKARLAQASKKLLDTIYDVVKQHGTVILTRKDDGGVEVDILRAEKK